MDAEVVSAMQSVCGGNRVEQAVPITKNAAQAGDIGGGQGTQRPQK
ncbi:MAG: hypothetical protein ACRDH5_01125 [bacterium]